VTTRNSANVPEGHTQTLPTGIKGVEYFDESLKVQLAKLY